MIEAQLEAVVDTERNARAWVFSRGGEDTGKVSIDARNYKFSFFYAKSVNMV